VENIQSTSPQPLSLLTHLIPSPSPLREKGDSSILFLFHLFYLELLDGKNT
jgi:hypothetical protein